ncbi:MAG: nucleotidyl transferase AbiEii/AbiGii toxin family protein [Bacteroides sp.]|nr:nucleotidyl transferase AbiEii/AbiGii toxin family protein [Bacteroides sp.]
MIRKECFTTEWIERVSSELHYNDKNLIEKVIRALSLLEMLVKAGCPLVFKGGTALMLILGKSAHRLSIDIDVICPPGTNIEDYLKSFVDFGFIHMELVERKQRDDADIPKSHSKFFYKIAYRNDTDVQSYILLDVLYEDVYYSQTRQIPIDSPFVRIAGDPLRVTVPSTEDILGDKLTAFAPNTTGIPYFKNGRSCSMEIAKQLYDVGRLFEKVYDLQITADVFHKIAGVELSYRSLGSDVQQVFNDIRQTALCISTRGKAGAGDFGLIQDGIIRVKSFMYKERYLIDNAIIDAARAAYLATLIEKGTHKMVTYSNNPAEIKDLAIRSSLTNKLNKLKGNLPEAYYYWAKTSELLEY